MHARTHLSSAAAAAAAAAAAFVCSSAVGAITLGCTPFPPN